jgi:hypothetical protein
MSRFIIAGILFLYFLPPFHPPVEVAFAIVPGSSQNQAPSTSTTDKAASTPGKAPSVSGGTSSKAGGTSSKAGGTSSKAGSASSKAGQSAIKAQGIQRSVVNIVVDRIEGGTIYSKDGQAFQVPSSIKVIDNTHAVTKMRTAELVFQNGSLVAVSIK